LIQDTTSASEVSFVTSFPSTSRIISHHFSHAFSEGDPDIGVIIFSIHGFSMST
jgi:hypothetical protein